MAKRKKGRKTKQRKQIQAQRQSEQTVQNREVVGSAVSPDNNLPAKDQKSKVQVSGDDIRDKYVRLDLIRSFVIAGIILVAYGVIWLFLNKTDLGDQLYQLINS